MAEDCVQSFSHRQSGVAGRGIAEAVEVAAVQRESPEAAVAEMPDRCP